MDPLRVGSFSKKLNELQNRVQEMQEHLSEQQHKLDTFATYVTQLHDELTSNSLEKDSKSARPTPQETTRETLKYWSDT